MAVFGMIGARACRRRGSGMRVANAIQNRIASVRLRNLTLSMLVIRRDDSFPRVH
jgi:hypothetical protein